MSISVIDDFIHTEIFRLEEDDADYIPEHLEDIAKGVERTFNTSCVCEYIGGFDSPGYDIDCYAFAYVDEDGNAGLYGYSHEMC